MKRRGSHIICTICCRDKDPSPELIPAVRRYRSKRIARAAALARKAGLPLVILSGKLGPVWADEPIPYYDLLLLPRAVKRGRRLIAVFLKKNGIRTIDYLLPDPALDPKVVPYLRAMAEGARDAGAVLRIFLLPPFPRLRTILVGSLRL
jgi:hypothetical protein